MPDNNTQFETGYCKRFNPEPWLNKEINWNNKLFIKDHVISFFHIPLNVGKVIIKNIEKLKKANVFTPEDLMLSDEKSLWGGRIFTLRQQRKYLLLDKHYY